MKILLVMFLCLAVTIAQAQEREHGFVGEKVDGKTQVWNSTKSKWVSIESFWQSFAKTSQSKSWGKATSYPNYGDVKEFDTLLIQLKQGPCLMQFFHTRWRRANDVQRWDDAFNEYGGCPFVFD